MLTTCWWSFVAITVVLVAVPPKFPVMLNPMVILHIACAVTVCPLFCHKRKSTLLEPWGTAVRYCVVIVPLGVTVGVGVGEVVIVGVGVRLGVLDGLTDTDGVGEDVIVGVGVTLADGVGLTATLGDGYGSHALISSNTIKDTSNTTPPTWSLNLSL